MNIIRDLKAAGALVRAKRLRGSKTIYGREFEHRDEAVKGDVEYVKRHMRHTDDELERMHNLTWRFYDRNFQRLNLGRN